MITLVISISVVLLLCIVLLKYGTMRERLRHSEHLRKGLMQSIKNKEKTIEKIKNLSAADLDNII